ncbi:Uncharacterised protein [Serratia proteamaculans]|nr:Uncharacterised protein [Serratia proteamaculans]
MLADQRAFAVIQTAGEQIGGAAYQHALSVVQRAAVDRQRPLAEDAAGFAAQAVTQGGSLGIHVHVAGRLQQTAVIGQRSAVQTQIAGSGDSTLLVVQCALAERQSKLTAHHLPSLIFQPGTAQLQALFSFNTTAAVVQCLFGHNLCTACGSGNQPLAVIQFIRLQPGMLAGRQLPLAVIECPADLCLQAPVLRGNHFAILVVQLCRV